MSFCNGRSSIGGNHNESPSNFESCSTTNFVPLGSCELLFDPSTLKKCKRDFTNDWHTSDFLPGETAADIDHYFGTKLDTTTFENCTAYSTLDTFATPDSYCSVPEDMDRLDYQEQRSKYGLDCDVRKAVPSCYGLNIYKKLNSVNDDDVTVETISSSSNPDDTERRKLGVVLDRLKNWENRNKDDRFLGGDVDFDKEDYEDSSDYENRIRDLRMICDRSFSSGLEAGLNFKTDGDYSWGDSGENPWEYCEWSYALNSCSTGGSDSFLGMQHNCQYYGQDTGH